MKTDIEIAQSAEMKEIAEIAEKLDLSEDDLELYGRYKAKVKLDILKTGLIRMVNWYWLQPLLLHRQVRENNNHCRPRPGSEQNRQKQLLP